MSDPAFPPPLDDAALDRIFREARTHNWWTDAPVGEATIRAIYDLARFGPTAANSTPARFTWLMSEASRRRLEPLLDEGNRAKTMRAPAVVIVAWDPDFHDQMPRLMPDNPSSREWFADDAVRAFEGQRSSTLQGAYLIVAARALGLDCGPMGGFDRAGVDAEFFRESGWRSNFLIAMGQGAAERLHPRRPRLPFEDANRII